MIVRYREYCLFIVFNILLLSKSNAQIDTPKLFNEIQSICDSLLNLKKQQSAKIGSYLIFLIKIKSENDSQTNVIINNIYNYI
jgi:hypothetical protein